MSTEMWIAVVAYVVAAWVLTGVALAVVDPKEIEKIDPIPATLMAVLWLPVLVIFASMMVTQAVVEWRKARAGADATGTGAEGEAK